MRAPGCSPRQATVPQQDARSHPLGRLLVRGLRGVAIGMLRRRGRGRAHALHLRARRIPFARYPGAGRARLG